MDLSKLPQRSAPPPQAPTPAAPPQPPPPRVAIDYSTAGDGILSLGFAEVWIVVILALIFLLIGRNFASYEISRVTGHPYHTGFTWNDDIHPPNTEVPYPELDGFVYLTDSSMFFFGIVLLGYAIGQAYVTMNLRRAAAVSLLTSFIVIAGTLYNLYVVVKLLSADVRPLMSLLAFGLGAYLAFHQLSTFKALRMRQATLKSASIPAQ
ncbi:MAG TPA: hypothetical protein VFW23_17040 [Tepidisphaeraceae bacterium]|nr:hypothetical protein [Tepidisphaeraceae bacterium]